jgi:hypothetical protein
MPTITVEEIRADLFPRLRAIRERKAAEEAAKRPRLIAQHELSMDALRERVTRTVAELIEAERKNAGALVERRRAAEWHHEQAQEHAQAEGWLLRGRMAR